MLFMPKWYASSGRFHRSNERAVVSTWAFCLRMNNLEAFGQHVLMQSDYQLMRYKNVPTTMTSYRTNNYYIQALFRNWTKLEETKLINEIILLFIFRLEVALTRSSNQLPLICNSPLLYNKGP